MSWTTTLGRALADLTPEDEDGLILLLSDSQFVSCFHKAFNRLTPAKQEAVTSTTRSALGLLSPRLQHAFLGFAEKIRST